MQKTLDQRQAGRVIVVVRETAMGRHMVVVDADGKDVMPTGKILATSRAGALALAGAILELSDLMAHTSGSA